MIGTVYSRSAIQRVIYAVKLGRVYDGRPRCGGIKPSVVGVHGGASSVGARIDKPVPLFSLRDRLAFGIGDWRIFRRVVRALATRDTGHFVM